MIPKVHREFSHTLSSLGRSFDAVLEVGALPDERSLLCCAAIRGAARRVGVNLNEQGDVDGAQVVLGDARALAFPDNSFDLVLSSSMLEHIPDFWRACSEMRRVLKPGGVLLVAVPGYVRRLPILNRLQRYGRHWPGLAELRRITLTFRVHDYPHDYYRFSEEAVRSVLLEGLEQRRVWSVAVPPRLFGLGTKPAN